MEQIILNEDDGLILMNYKEPLTKVKEGFGYYGALLLSLDKKKLQCHICGNLYEHVGVHLRHAHKMTAYDYKVKFQLSTRTALISESVRMKLKQIAYNSFHNLSQKEKKEIHEKAIEGTKKFNKERGSGWTTALEIKNKRGTCPDQTLAKIAECRDSIGHVPSRTDFKLYCGTQRYLHLCKSHFGSWTNALKRCGFKNKEWKKGKETKKTNDELLNALSEFYEDTGKIPTASDARRGNIPYEDIYVRRFGGWQKARKLAGIPEPTIGHPTWTH